MESTTEISEKFLNFRGNGRLRDFRPAPKMGETTEHRAGGGNVLKTDRCCVNGERGENVGGILRLRTKWAPSRFPPGPKKQEKQLNVDRAGNNVAKMGKCRVNGQRGENVGEIP